MGVSVISPGAIGGAGMFADSGAAMPPLIGTGTPRQVGAAVVTAIERNRAEVTVAPLRQRALARFAANAPEMSSRLAGGIVAKAADEIAAGQTDKR
ncbi:conserved short-chain dehydrogenase domain protein [Mycobacterium kansasii 824]|nr:conserved short-chain dehydrogenase domain protein [Mycobacterium kansasii 824]